MEIYEISFFSAISWQAISDEYGGKEEEDRVKKRRSSKTLIIFVENKYPDNRLPVQTAAPALIQYCF